MPVVIDALDRAVGWARSHVFQELWKVVNPLRTDAYSATAVVGIVLIVGHQTAALHAGPRFVFSGHSSVTGMPVNECASGAAFYHPAAATGRFASFQAVAVDRGCLTAIASAIPKQDVAAVSGPREHFKATESTTCQINNWRGHTRTIAQKDMRCCAYRALNLEGI